MTDEKRKDEWAWQQIEAAADRSLEPSEQQRFAAALARDPRLEQALVRARALLARLRETPQPAVPRSLLRQLLSIPNGARQGRRAPSAGFWLRTALPAGAALAVLLAIGVLRTPGPEEPDPSRTAVQDFVVAMAYLQKGTRIARSEMSGQVRDGFRDAFEVSRESLLERDSIDGNGG